MVSKEHPPAVHYQNAPIAPPPASDHETLVEAHLAAQTKMLLRALENLEQHATPFIVRAWTQGGPTPLTSANRGIIRQVHNPTAVAITLVLATGGNPETAILNLLVQPNSVPASGLYIPFYAPLFVLSGNGAIITGDVFA